MRRLIAELLLLAVLCACATAADRTAVKPERRHVGQQREEVSANGVRLMSWNDAVDNFAAPADRVTIEFRAVNTSPARKCYRWAVFTTNAVPGRSAAQSPGWVEIGPAPRRGKWAEDDVGGWLQWRTTSSGQYPPVHILFEALNVPERGRCQSYDEIYRLDLSTERWYVDTDRLVALAGVDESGWPQLHKLLGDNVAIPRPDRSAQHISELAAYRVDKTVSPQYRFVRVEADAGRDRAMYSLGLMYTQGDGVRQDYSEAIKWFRKAAERGNAGAQYILGTGTVNGKPITPDEVEARSWIRKAADQGEAHAQLQLGILLADGRGGRADTVAAQMWLGLADNHLPASESEARQLAKRKLDEVAGRMTPAQIGDAKMLAARWRPTGWPSPYSDSLPNWMAIASERPGVKLEFDSSSVTVNENLRAAWTSDSFDAPQKGGGRVSYVRSKTFWIFDCSAHTSQEVVSYYYDPEGRPVWTMSFADVSRPIDIDPYRLATFEVERGTLRWATLNAVCSYPAER